jgi:hypothetical protein
MVSNAVCVLETLVLDHARSRLLHAIERGPQCPRSRKDDWVFDPCLVLERVGLQSIDQERMNSGRYRFSIVFSVQPLHVIAVS